MDPNPQLVAPKNNRISGRTKVALWCLIGPTGLFIVTFLLFAIVNWLLAGSGMVTAGTNSESLFNKPSMVTTISNIILFLAGLIAFLTWLPGVIIGIILLATKKPSSPQA